MKTFISIVLIVISTSSFGQAERQKDYLVCYGQVWGFLKYFHPTPSEKDWDRVLLDDFDKVLACSNDSDFDTIITKLIHHCGNFTPKVRVVADSLVFKESFDWLENGLISPGNKYFLSQLHEQKPSFQNKYIIKNPAGHPRIVNEVEYESYVQNPSIQFLALTRYWNCINYFCPNRDIIPRNWTTVYRDHLSAFIQANTYEDYYFSVARITSEIRDGHGFIRADNNPMSTYKFVPFYCENVSEGYYITLVWQDSLNLIDLQKMDRIVAIDGMPIEEKVKQIGTFISTSNDYELSKATYYLRISNKDSVAVEVERDGELIQQVVQTIDKETLMKRYKRSKITPVSRPYVFTTDSISGKEYCYLDMGKLERSDITIKFKRKLNKTDHLIIDSRNYPNWTLIKLSGILIKGKRKFAKFKEMNFDYPGSYVWTMSQTIGNNRNGYEGAIYVLVDYHTMSQAEYTVMALQQHPNTIVIGGQTAGADGNISVIPLPFGIRSVYSGLGVFYPDGTPSQQIGILRDYQLVQNKSFLEERKDVILEKALELIRAK